MGVGVGQSLPSLMGVQGFLEGTLHRLKEKKKLSQLFPLFPNLKIFPQCWPLHSCSLSYPNPFKTFLFLSLKVVIGSTPISSYGHFKLFLLPLNSSSIMLLNGLVSQGPSWLPHQLLPLGHLLTVEVPGRG